VTFDVDVAIVGGGPAGTSTALHLVRDAGIRADRIAIFEKAAHPREKPCAGAISAWGIEALARIGVGVDVPNVPMRGLRILAEGRVGAYDACKDGPLAFGADSLGIVVRRSEYDASLWQRVREDGVVAHDREAVVALDRITGGWRITTRARTLTARLLAACDGAGSSVRKRLGIREAARKGHLYVLETPPRATDVGANAEQCDFDLGPSERGLEGYYWDFPTIIDGARAVSRGIYHANMTPRRDVKDVLARSLAERGIDMAREKLKPFSTRPFVRGAPLAFEGGVLVGEAAGIDQTTGEGIAQAILLGAIAARHLARAVRLGAQRFDAYERDVVRSRVGRHMLQSAWLARRVYGARGAMWRRFLVSSPLARAAGARWYDGRSLSWGTKARLAMGLVGAAR
jgi:flavin-dependent dehydrogenase